MTRTASDQSISSSSVLSGSLAIEASISSSVRLRNLSQSVLPFRGSSRETTVIFFSFIASRPSRGLYVADVATHRTDHNDFDVFKEPENHIAHFALSIRATNDRRPVEDDARIVEIDMPLTQGPIALVIVPIK